MTEAVEAGLGIQEQASLKGLFGEAVAAVTGNVVERNLLFEAMQAPVPTDHRYTPEVVNSLLGRLRDTSPTVEDLRRRVDSSLRDVLKGVGKVIPAPPATGGDQLAYMNAARTLVGRLAKVYEVYGSPRGEETKKAIFSSLRRAGWEGNRDAVQRVRFLEEYSRDYVDKLMIAASVQDLTVEEARRALDLEAQYRRAIATKPSPRRKFDEAYKKHILLWKEADERLKTKAGLWQPAEIVPAAELIEPREDNYQAFRDFARARAAELAGRSVPSLKDFIYRQFYGRASEATRHVAGVPETDNLMAQLRQQVAWVENSIVSTPNYVKTYDYGWLFGVNGKRGIAANLPPSELGRFYLNVRPDSVQHVFRAAIAAAGEKNLRFDIKMSDFKSSSVEVSDLNRADKIVIYFGTDEQAQAVGLVRDIWTKYTTAFEVLRPRFTVGVGDVNGREMAGVGFAQEPVPIAGNEESFGNRRAGWLAASVLEAKGQGLTVDDPRFDLEGVLRRIAPQFGINFEHPAFNEGLAGEVKYPELLKVVGADTGRIAQKAT